uniref:peptidylprolyl isomerase n=1 Tax=Nostoc sp. PCC 9201 TaxID=2099382 RepID=A0A2P0ZGN0_9NOSO|nr:putative parvulin peptidyl-prolyl isomerase [Nostoc sp. PCC 9201]
MTEEIVVTEQDIFHHLKLSNRLPSLIDELVRLKVIKSTATQIGIEVSTEELQKSADYLRITQKLTSSDDTWKWLHHHGMSLDDFEESVYNFVITTKLAKHLFNDQIEAFFYENQLNYNSVSFHEIVLDDEDLAMELYFAIAEGEISFAEVASQYIQDQELQRCGGYRGKVPRQELKAEIAVAIYASEPPQLLKPILTSKGVHLIFVDEIIQPQLNDKLRETILLELFMQWLQQKVSEMQVVRAIQV